MELLYKTAYTLTTLSAIGLGTFVLLKNPKSRVNVTWFFASLSVGIWSLEVPLSFYARDYDQALFWIRITNFSASYIPVTITHFFFSLVNKRSNRVLWFGYLYNLTLAPFIMTPWFVRTVTPKVVFSYYPNPGPLYIIFTLVFFFFIFYGHWTLIMNLKSQDSMKQNQIRYVLIATITGFICGTTTFLPVYDIPINPWPSLFTPVYSCVIAYAIARHRLMDIRVIIRRSAVYSLLVACITATYLVIVLVMERGFQGFLGYHSIFATIVVAFLIAIFFNPLRDRIQVFVDRRLFNATPVELAVHREQLLVEVRKSEQMKAVATLAAGMAHEIKNPLASIKTFAEYLPQKYDDPSFREKFSRIISQEVDKVNGLVQRLLDFARPAQPQLQSVQLPRLLSETLEFLQGTLLQKNIRVETSYAKTDDVFADPAQIRQVFLNVLLNSIEAMEQPGSIEVSTTQLNGHVEVTVADTGSGISKKDLPHAFDPFFTTKPRGTGLGLSVVHSIVHEHGGRVAINSRAGKGTTVRIRLPIIKGGANGSNAYSHRG